MSIEKVRHYLQQFGRDKQIREFAQSSATVELAAHTLGVEPGRIAKTLSFRNNEGAIIVVTAGDTKIDNARFKSVFGLKAKMLTAEEALEYTGHAVGGICPFAIENVAVKVYLDSSLQRFKTVFPACGSANSAIELSCVELEQTTPALGWVEVSKPV